MNTEVRWDNEEHTVVRLTVLENWAWPDLYEANNEIIAMMRSTDQIVHLLIDYTQTSNIPLGGVIMHARNILSAYPKNWNLLILVTRALLIQRLASVFQSTFRGGIGSRVYCVASFDEAYRLTSEHSLV